MSSVDEILTLVDKTENNLKTCQGDAGMKRREFLKKSLAGAAVAGGFWPSWFALAVESPEAGSALPKWKPGELELHFIYTGCGENCFYRLPDGTAILNDVGDFYRPRDLKDIPLLPSPDRLGGEWVSRYIQRVYPEKTIDYVVFSHWHGDHTGTGAIDHEKTPAADFRYRNYPDGLSGNGIVSVAQDFSFKRYFDHQFPRQGQFKSKGGLSFGAVMPWFERERGKGLVAEPFRIGALNQIAMLRDAAKYKDVFSIRNLCANGVAWDGENGVHDYVAVHDKATGGALVNENVRSLAFVMRYGKFGYFAGGDVSGVLKNEDGSNVDYESVVGRLAGRVNVCKTNHHGYHDAMSEGFVRAVQADAYISCVWCPRHVIESTLEHMTSRALHGGREPLFVPNIYPASCRDRFEKAGRFGAIPDATRFGAHVVVKVAPGGDAYKIYLVDARDESMRVMGCLDFSS